MWEGCAAAERLLGLLLRANLSIQEDLPEVICVSCVQESLPCTVSLDGLTCAHDARQMIARSKRHRAGHAEAGSRSQLAPQAGQPAMAS